jgi:hypothetical protein
MYAPTVKKPWMYAPTVNKPWMYAATPHGALTRHRIAACRP